MAVQDTEPSEVSVGTTEQILYAWDTSNYVEASGDTSIEDPVTTLVDVTASPNVTVDLPDQPSVNGLIISQWFRGSDLIAGNNYVALVSFTGVQSGNVMTMRTRLSCPF